MTFDPDLRDALQLLWAARLYADAIRLKRQHGLRNVCIRCGTGRAHVEASNAEQAPFGRLCQRYGFDHGIARHVCKTCWRQCVAEIHDPNYFESVRL